MKTIELQVHEFSTAGEAIQWAEASGCGTPIMLEGSYCVCSEADVERLEMAGVEFAKLAYYEMPNGDFRLISTPINNR